MKRFFEYTKLSSITNIRFFAAISHHWWKGYILYALSIHTFVTIHTCVKSCYVLIVIPSLSGGQELATEAGRTGSLEEAEETTTDAEVSAGREGIRGTIILILVNISLSYSNFRFEKLSPQDINPSWELTKNCNFNNAKCSP